MTMTHASGIGNLSKTRADLAARHLSSIILYGYCRCLDAMRNAYDRLPSAASYVH